MLHILYILILAQPPTKPALTPLKMKCRNVDFKRVYLGGLKLAEQLDMLINGPSVRLVRSCSGRLQNWPRSAPQST
jgi:hypothetical protein